MIRGIQSNKSTTKLHLVKENCDLFVKKGIFSVQAKYVIESLWQRGLS